MWPINSCDLIWASICVVGTIIFERQLVNDNNKHGIFFICFCVGLGRQGLMCMKIYMFLASVIVPNTTIGFYLVVYTLYAHITVLYLIFSFVSVNQNKRY